MPDSSDTALPPVAIDRRSPIPFYFQLTKLLTREIEAGRWRTGERLPSEPAICAQFGVSRTTVRQALAALESEGLVRREKGRGTFVGERRSGGWLLQSAHGFYEEAERAGHAVRSRVLRRDLEPLPAWAAEALGLRAGSDGVTVERLRWMDDRLVMYVISHFPAPVAGTLLAADLETSSLYGVLEAEEGLTVAGGRRVVEAARAERELASLLEVEPGSPLLRVEAVSWDDRRQPFECYRAWHRADRTKIEVHVVHEEAAAKAGLGLGVLGAVRP
jgi:DNA-binding GntR family transcriptional regulator